jgi:glycosyltransferase involved in cell wall biosynthesis
MHILALDTYHGGSHKEFITNWKKHSYHQWSLHTLAPHHWKWRMSHGAITFNQQLQEKQSENWDLLFCTDMLNLAEFIGLADKKIQALPRIIYFHENQLTYPSQTSDHRDLRYAFINFTSALAADEVWFNSNWHKENFLQTLEYWLMRMPDNRPRQAINAIADKSRIHSPGIEHDCTPADNKTSDNCLTILWAARWEHDKNPECFFNALNYLKQNNINFKLNVIGSASKTIPDIFINAEKDLSDHINIWGYANSRQDYIRALQSSDVIVSTANHEFFGIAVMEAVATGCIPILPDRLAYPETMANFKNSECDFFYDGSEHKLAEQLILLSEKIKNKTWLENAQDIGKNIAKQYLWDHRSQSMDKDIESVIRLSA